MRTLSLTSLIIKTAILTSVSTVSISASAGELWFPPSLLGKDAALNANLSYFNGGRQVPGKYVVDIYVNQEFIIAREIMFIKKPDAEGPLDDASGLKPCFNLEDYLDLGVKISVLKNMPPEQTCYSPEDTLSASNSVFDFQNMILRLDIPQDYLELRPRGWIDPLLWDDGIPAFLLNYSASQNINHSDNWKSRNSYIRLGSGINIGPWRLRDDRSWSESYSAQSRIQKWQHGSTYLYRAVIPLRSNVIIGESTTDGEIFDSLGFRGIRLMTDDSMFPDSQRGYAPVIKGVAVTNAQVSIKQNGYVVYQTNVAPGPFTISDLHPLYSSGDLDVSITEADGTLKTMVIPYSSVPLLLREGRVKYSITAGEYRNTSQQYRTPGFSQVTLSTGLSAGLTAYTGTQYSSNYRSVMSGIGVNMGVAGAISADISHADSKLADGKKYTGQSLRFLYSHALNSTGTSFRLTGYRYSTKGFFTLEDTALKGMAGWKYDSETFNERGELVPRPVTDYYNLHDNKKHLIQANISQRAGKYGLLYLTGSYQTYWNKPGVTESLQAGYSSSFGQMRYSLSLNRNKVAGFSRPDENIFANISFPLGRRDRNVPPVYSSLSLSRSKNGSTRHQAGLSGTLLENNNLNWSVNQGYAKTEGYSNNLSLNYRNSYGTSNAGYSWSRNYQQVNYGLTGSLIIHQEGLTLGQTLNDSGILIAIPGAPDVPVEHTDIKTDWRGYAVRSNTLNYRENRVAIDTSRLDDETEVDGEVIKVVPTRGAIVRAEFKSRTGFRALITLTRDGKPLPFGTIVTVTNSSGIVGDDGQVFLSGLESKGYLKAQWGSDEKNTCTAPYSISEDDMSKSFIHLNSQCK